jgi:hypothetical protein
MADENRSRDSQPVSGELMPTNRNIPDVTTRNPLRRLFDQLFHLPILNRGQKKSFESQREMVEEATKLGKAIIDHQRTRDRLTNIDTLLIERCIIRIILSSLSLLPRKTTESDPVFYVVA